MVVCTKQQATGFDWSIAGIKPITKLILSAIISFSEKKKEKEIYKNGCVLCLYFTMSGRDLLHRAHQRFKKAA